MRPPRRPVARWGRVLALVVAVLVLAGCRLDVTAVVTMKDDGSGQVTVTARADAELLAKAPAVLSDLRLDDIRAAGWTVDGPTAASDGGEALTLTKPFVTPQQAALVLGELSGPGGPLAGVQLDLTHRFATVGSQLQATAGIDGVAALGDSQLTAVLGGQAALADRVTGDVGDGLHLTVVAQLPGRVVSSNGTVSADGTAVSWSPDLRGGARTDLQAAFEQRDQGALDARSRGRLARVGLVVWAALLVVGGGIAAAVVARRRRRRPTRPSPSPFVR